MVERQLPKLYVVGSIPIARSSIQPNPKNPRHHQGTGTPVVARGGPRANAALGTGRTAGKVTGRATDLRSEGG